MFTGIIEALGTVDEADIAGSNITFRISSPLSAMFRPDQSVSHDGVCLTVEKTGEGWHQVTAIDETLQKTTLAAWKPGTLVNLEQCLPINGRIDGHFVQGHVDTTATCLEIVEKAGSREYRFGFAKQFAPLVIEKGSVSISGVSLTAFDVGIDSLRVALIPYTLAHTNLQYLLIGQKVNVEFDVLGKYILRREELTNKH